MAMTQAERSAKAAGKRQAAQEEELRLRVRPGTKQALADLMAWAELEEQGEALTLMIHHLQALGPAVAVRFLTPPRHEITVSENVALAFDRKSLLMIQQDSGDEILRDKRSVNADVVRSRN